MQGALGNRTGEVGNVSNMVYCRWLHGIGFVHTSAPLESPERRFSGSSTVTIRTNNRNEAILIRW